MKTIIEHWIERAREAVANGSLVVEVQDVNFDPQRFRIRFRWEQDHEPQEG